MENDPLESLLRKADPLGQRGSLHADDSDLAECRSQWTQLSAKRIRQRRRLPFVMATAAAVLAAVTLGRSWLDHREPIQVTADPPSLHNDDRSPKSDLASRQTRSLPATSLDVEADRTKPLQPSRKIESPPRRRSPDMSSPPRLATKQLAPERQLDEFEAFVRSAGELDSEQWMKAAGELANRNSRRQRAAIEMVPLIKDDQLRFRAFELVADAAGNTRDQVLHYWLSTPRLRPLSWNRLVRDADFQRASVLLPMAKSNEERLQLCRTIVDSADRRSLPMILQLAQNDQWRSAVRIASEQLDHDHLPALIQLMRSRHAETRTAAAFVLASVAGEQVDQALAKMILQGRYRQPAYLALLSRNTPQAKAFLAQAALQPRLTPALVSARHNFASLEKRLQQWIAQSQGERNESSETSKQSINSESINQSIADRSVDSGHIG